MKKANILFSGDTSNRTNWGCRSTTFALRKILEQHSNIEYTVDTANWNEHLNCVDPDFQKHSDAVFYGNDFFSFTERGDSRKPAKRTKPLTSRLMKAFENHLIKKNRPLSHLPQTADDFDVISNRLSSLNNSPLVNALKRVDAVIINGEGAFIPTGYSAGRAHLMLAYLALTQFNKPTFLVNHTADLQHPQLYDLASKVYPLLSGCLVREKLSLKMVDPFFKDKNSFCNFVPDAVFSLKPSSPALWSELSKKPDYFSTYPNTTPSFNPSKPYICVGGSAEFRFNPQKNANHVSDLIKVCRGLSDLCQIVIVSIEHHEEPYLREVGRKLNLPVVGCNISVQQSIDIMANCRLYVGGRWHTAIKAALGGRPSVLLGTNSDFKTRGLIELLELNHPVFPFHNINSLSNEIVRHAKKAIEDDELSKNIINKVKHFRETIESAYGFITDNFDK